MRDEKTQRLRNAQIICENFARNITFYRVGHEQKFIGLLGDRHPQAQFWRQVNGNFLDGCIVEWCKLLGDKNAKHNYKKLVSDCPTFEGSLFQSVFTGKSEFDSYVGQMRFHRDKFAAHLDDLPTMKIPNLDLAQDSIFCLQDYLASCEARPGDLVGLADTPQKFKRGVQLLREQAAVIYRQACEQT